MIESELAEVDPPPIGDLVDNAIRDGRRMRRTRLVHRTVACVAAVGVLAIGLGMATANLRPDQTPGTDGGYAANHDPPGIARPTGQVSPEPSTTRATRAVPSDAPTMALEEVQARLPDSPGRMDPAAAPAAVLVALESVLPAGSTVAHAGGQFATYTGVQVFLNRGAGFGMIRVAVTHHALKPPPRCDVGRAGIELACTTDKGGALIHVFEIESNCVQRRGVNVYRSDGIAIQVNVASCIVDGAWTSGGIDSVDEKVLDVDEAVKIGLDPVWNARSLNEAGQKAHDVHPSIPLLTAFNGVGS